MKFELYEFLVWKMLFLHMYIVLEKYKNKRISKNVHNFLGKIYHFKTDFKIRQISLLILCKNSAEIRKTSRSTEATTFWLKLCVV